ncbi:hypothetical protein GS535_03485 [Saccharibacter sp. EH611]|uniref:hypothetical protein n=1 Tax=unclassified Saccharibacter TaxID=2648722 RepID=UPI001320E322|nr:MULTISPECIES: hypothetical protein [unclassified Saccharibacter]MXV35619.1 hypothetical protein [Saccharibacter sp. EH611]MXV65769.1 hypothetical protein [Saccharibacter sp. EH60]
MRKVLIGLTWALLSGIGSAEAANIGPWTCTDNGMPICSYTQDDTLFQLIPTIEGEEIQVGVIAVGQCHKDATLNFSNGLQLHAGDVTDFGPAKCDYVFNVKDHSMDVMSKAFLTSTKMTFHAGVKTFTAPISENDDLVHVLQYWKRQKEQ